MSSKTVKIGRYELLSRVGMGGMAEAFRARATGPRGYQRELIIKRILPELASRPDFVRAFIAEAKILSMINHPNVVGIYDFGEDNGRHYLALEYLDGASLSSLLMRARGAGKTLPVGLIAFIGREICRGLSAVHTLCDHDAKPLRVIHRDVTPSNVMTTTKGAVKLLDFGIAKMVGQDVTRVGQIKGKAGYLAPEQIVGGEVDARVDLFALGVVIYEMLRLEPLFYGEGGDLATAHRTLSKNIDRPSLFRQDVSPSFENAVLRALSREPDLRYQTASDMERDLDNAFSRSGIATEEVAGLMAEIRSLPGPGD